MHHTILSRKTRSRMLGLFVLVFLSIAAFHPAMAQWELTKPGLLNTDIGEGGAITSCQGMVWAGKDTLWISSDSGLTWQNSGFIIPASSDGDAIIGIAFHDKMNGVMVTRLGIFYTTSNGGWNWDSVAFFSWPYGVCFDGTSNDILVAAPKGFYATSDGGKSWTNTIIPNSYPYFVQSSVPGHAWAFVYNKSNSTGLMYRSTDFGMTWNQHGSAGGTNFFALDSTDESTIYTVNNDMSCLLVSHDGGLSWNTSEVHPYNYFSGAIASSTCAVFAATSGSAPVCPAPITDTGFYCSTDRGNSWFFIAGPGSPALDLSYLTVLDNNSSVLGDCNGDMWRNTDLPVGMNPEIANGLYFGISSLSAQAGDTLNIPVYYDTSSSSVNSIDIPFTFDTSILHLIGFQSTVSGLSVATTSYSNGVLSVLLEGDGIMLNGEVLLGYMQCIPYLTDSLNTTILLPSVSSLLTVTPCMVTSLTNSVNITIAGCGDATLLQFMKTGTIPSVIRSVIPDPATNEITVIGGTGAFTIFDPLGRSYSIPQNANTLDVSSLPSGMYFVSDGLSSAKFLKE